MQGNVSRVRLFQLSIRKQPNSPWRWVATKGAFKLPVTPLLGHIANVTKILQLPCSKQEDMKIKFIRKATQVKALNCVTAVAA